MTEALGYAATVLFSIMMVPQLVKSLKERQAAGVSPWPFFVGMVANVIAFVYATRIGQPPLQIKYTIAFCVLAMCVYAYFRCDRS